MNSQEGVNIRLIKTDKFKDIGCSIRFLNPLTPKGATIRSLLALMLCDRTQRYDTKQKMADIADELYGVTLNAQTMGYGKAQVLEVRSKMVNPKYVKSEDMLTTWLGFLREVLFYPKLVDGLLDNDILQEAKEILKFKLDRLHDEPSQWAVLRCLQIAGKDEALGVSALGDPSLLDEIQVADVSAEYQTMMESAPVEIMLCGDFDESIMRQVVVDAFPFGKRDAGEAIHYSIDTTPEESKVSEYRDISQTSVMMLYFTHTSLTSDDYWKLKVANAVLGQYSSSLLFQEVREKHSLCYSVYSSLISFDGAMGISTGIEADQLDKTLVLIKEQVQRVIDGDFDDTLLATTKELLVNSLRSIQDDMGSLFSLAYQNAVLHQDRDVKDFIDLVMDTTREEVMDMMKRCTHALTYVLTKEEDHEKD